ncbi:MAG: Beta-N-acetylhexosaminidase [Acidobacteriota bacterium]|nr:Beta-N-acetylhexosaminidase [Acidobacteriota bacterium]
MADYRLSLKEKISQLFMFGFKGTEITGDIRRSIETNNPGFIILFARNIETISQVKELTRDIHALGKIPPFIYTDQEGGTVVQFKELAATVVSPMGLAAGGVPRDARKAGRIIGAEMKALGVNGVLAPSLDVNYEENNPIIGIRSFSDDPETVAKYAAEFAAGLNEKAVACCGKHYPGHGGTTADSHLEIPEVAVSPEYFSYYCYLPFFTAARAGIDAIMTGHLLFPALSPHIATFCPYLVRQLLRDLAGYNGVIMSDCLEMKAVKEHFSAQEMVKNAMDAGIDLMIASHSPDFQAELLDALYSQVKNGVIPEKRIDESLGRILKLKEKYPPLPPSTLNRAKKNSTTSPGC